MLLSKELDDVNVGIRKVVTKKSRLPNNHERSDGEDKTTSTETLRKHVPDQLPTVKEQEHIGEVAYAKDSEISRNTATSNQTYLMLLTRANREKKSLEEAVGENANLRIEKKFRHNALYNQPKIHPWLTAEF